MNLYILKMVAVCLALISVKSVAVESLQQTDPYANRKMTFYPSTITIHDKEYPIIVTDNLSRSLKEGHQDILEKFNQALEKIKSSNPSPKIAGFKIVLCGQRVTVERFLGNKAK